MSSVAATIGSPQKVDGGLSTHPDRDSAETLPWLPCTVSLELATIRFTIGDLLRLCTGTVIETACHHTSDIPLWVNGQLIGWTEFEVVGDKLAARITEMA